MKGLAATSLGTETGRSVLATPLAALVLFLFFCLPCLAPAASAEAPQAPALSGRVNDLAGMMSPQARAQVEGILADLERTDSTQVAVLTVPSLEGDSIEAFGLKVAEKWGLGQKGKDNGALILVSRDDRKMRIEVGYGLEGRLTDLLSGRIVDSVMAPRFKAGDFDGGFIAGARAVAQAVRGEFTAKPRELPLQRSSRAQWLAIALFGAIGVLMLLVKSGGLVRKMVRNDPDVGNDIIASLSSGGSNRTYVRGRRGSGGGFSGGGGGFGGGGASGGW